MYSINRLLKIFVGFIDFKFSKVAKTRIYSNTDLVYY